MGHRIEGKLEENWDSDGLVLLPNKSYFSELVVRQASSENHEGVDATKARVRREDWNPQLTKLARMIERLKPSPSFYFCGFYQIGPVWIKDIVKKRVQMKCYGVLFTCLFHKDVYLDIASGYETENFFLVLFLFITLCGCPSKVYFDTVSQLPCSGKE